MTGALVRLGLLLSLLAAIQRLHVIRVDRGTPVTLAAGALLLCGLFAGKVARGFGLPRLTGYLLIGVVIGPYLLGFIPPEGVAGLELVKGLAVSLIALTAGSELKLGLIQRVGRKVVVLCAGVVGCVFLATLSATLMLRPWIAFLAPLTQPQAVAVSALLATVIVSFSPTVTIAIVQETRARGSFTEFLMALVIIGDLFVMVLFALAAGLTRATFGAALSLLDLARGIGWELFGSIGVGAVLGLIVLLYLVKVGRELPVFLCASCFVSAEMGAYLHLSPLLVSLAAGAVIANLDEGQATKLHHAVERAGLPVFALFFAAAGAGLHLDVIGTVGPIALVLALVRAGSIYLGVRTLAPKPDPRLGQLLWMGLISQAGVTFGLAALVRRTFPTFGEDAEVLIIAMVTLHELIGPVLMRRGLQRSGEVMADLEAERV